MRNADYEKQELGLSAIREEIITELSRTVCYNQTIYDDERLEATEYAGLTLAVQGSPATTALTTVGIQHTALRIIDNDSKMIYTELYHDIQYALLQYFASIFYIL